MGNIQNNINPQGVLSLNSMAALLQTLGAAGNGMGDKLIQFITALLGITGKATGGPTTASNMYMVGEKGPELFVPKVDGTIIPNNVTSQMFKYKGGRAGGGDVFAKDLLNALGDKPTPSNLADLSMWIAGENTKAKFNPLATSTSMPGAVNAGPAEGFTHNDAGVKNYNSYKQGVDATVKTLTGKPEYKGILDALSAGNVSTTDFKSIVAASPWGTFKSSVASGGETAAQSDAITAMFGSNGASFNAAFQQYLKTGKITKGTTLSSILGNDSAGTIAGLMGGSGGSTVNYGGVTFNMNVMGGDPKKIQAAIQQAVKDLQTSKWVATK
jgi:hypothetical protein